MGQRGPLTDPGSRRGRAALPGYQPDKPEQPSPPLWLSTSARVTFRQLVTDLADAGVPIKRVDAHAIAMAAHTVSEAQAWALRAKRSRKPEAKIEAAKLCARFQRDSQSWLNVIGASPAARARLGLRGATNPKKPGTVLSILNARETRQ